MGTLFFFDQCKYEQARQAFRRSLRSRKDDSEALWALGNCYSELGRPKIAERYFERAPPLNGANKPALAYNLGNALFDQGRFREALDKYQQVTRTKEKSLARLGKRNAVCAKAAINSLKRKQIKGIKGAVLD